jgi:Tfp pilus assembly protein PilV
MMIALLVLSVGLVGAVSLVSTAISANARSRRDSTSAALAEMVLGQLSAACPLGVCGGGNATVTVTDCSGTNWSVTATGTAAGSGATLNAVGNIDYTVAYSAVPAGYAMQYTVCSVANNTRTVYDVRWNITTLPSGSEEYVVVGARALNSNNNNVRIYAPPVSVRSLIGNDGN